MCTRKLKVLLRNLSGIIKWGNQILIQHMIRSASPGIFNIIIILNLDANKSLQAHMAYNNILKYTHSSFQFSLLNIFSANIALAALNSADKVFMIKEDWYVMCNDASLILLSIYWTTFKIQKWFLKQIGKLPKFNVKDWAVNMKNISLLNG